MRKITISAFKPQNNIVAVIQRYEQFSFQSFFYIRIAKRDRLIAEGQRFVDFKRIDKGLSN